jgi:hypothetical protein
MFVLSRVVDFRKFLFLFRDFLVRMWLAKALFLSNLPVAVLLNRFNAPLFVFILGMKNLAPQLENWPPARRAYAPEGMMARPAT